MNNNQALPQPHEFLEWTAAPLSELENYGKEYDAAKEDESAHLGLLSLSRGYMWPTEVTIDEVGGDLTELSFGVGLEEDEKNLLIKAIQTWGREIGLSMMVKRRFTNPFNVDKKCLIPRINPSMDLLVRLPTVGRVRPRNQVIEDIKGGEIWFTERDGAKLIGSVMGVLPVTVDWQDEHGSSRARIVTDYDQVCVDAHCVYF